MKDTITQALRRLQTSFQAFSTGQKFTAILGSGALLLAAFMVFHWASKPSYAPLFSNLSAADASAVVDKLDAQGVPHQLGNGGTTVLVPENQVYDTRIALSGAGIPSGSDNGYSILDNQSLSTSSFKEQTDFKRAMEGELDHTIEAIDGVKTAVVHLAMPPKQVFADSQDPTTASVLVEMTPGSTLDTQQVTAVTNLVASSIDGLKPSDVTVADSRGQVLSAADGTGIAAASGRYQQVNDFQDQMTSRVQKVLDRVLGPGNSTVQVTADLDFDKAVTETTRYFPLKPATALASSSSSETYNGTGGTGGSTGVVGPDGQMDTSLTGTGAGTGKGTYEKKSSTSDNAVDKTVEQREAAPGGVTALHVGVVVDAKKAGGASPSAIQSLLSSSLGITAKRGDTVQVSSMPFDRSVEAAAAKELKAADAASASAQTKGMLRTAGLVLVLVLMLVYAWLRGRRRDQARAEATTYVVEQLRRDALERSAIPGPVEPSPATMALERADDHLSDAMRDEIVDLVERQPADVAALLRGWLVDQP